MIQCSHLVWGTGSHVACAVLEHTVYWRVTLTFLSFAFISLVPELTNFHQHFWCMRCWGSKQGSVNARRVLHQLNPISRPACLSSAPAVTGSVCLTHPIHGITCFFFFFNLVLLKIRSVCPGMLIRCGEMVNVERLSWPISDTSAPRNSCDEITHTLCSHHSP